jgi:hypothetical protein
MARTRVQRTPKQPAGRSNSTPKEADTPFEEEAAAENDPLAEEAARSVASSLFARRRVEQYWERKRLKEQIGDYDDLDLD